MMKLHVYRTMILVGLATIGQQAFATNKVDYVDLKKGGINIHDGKINVNPVNGNYSQVSLATVPFNVEMRAACKGQNVLKSAFVAYGKEGVSKEILESSDNYRKLVSTRSNKTLPWTDVKLDVPLNKLGFNPVALCQDYMSKKLSQGVSKQQILASDHVITRNVDLMAVASCGRPSKDKVHYGWDNVTTSVSIVCKAGSMPNVGGINANTSKPASPAGAFAVKGEITKVAFVPVKVNNTGSCPMNIDFQGEIGMSGGGNVKYRVLFPGAEKTNWMTLKFTKAGTLNVPKVTYKATQSFPNAVATIEVEEPTKKKLSKNFKVTCLKAGPNQIQAPVNGGLQLKKIQSQ